MWKGHLEAGMFIQDNVKLVYQNAGTESPSVEKPTVLSERVPGHPLGPNDAVEGSGVDRKAGPMSAEDDAPGRRWEAKLEPNGICGRLNAMVAA
jgi:hypothetical protein